MSVQRNPYSHWGGERSNSDYRGRETQASSLTRQMMRQPEYLTTSNRVNPGPGRNLRAKTAESLVQIPHNLRNEDIWGWQGWTEISEYYAQSDVSNNLLEGPANREEIPLYPPVVVQVLPVFDPRVFKNGVFQ
jgi:hypothetical protein